MEDGYFDMCLVHVPVGHRNLGQSWRELVRAKEEGLCRSVGVSNFRVEDLEVIERSGSEVPTVNQVSIHEGVHGTVRAKV